MSNLRKRNKKLKGALHHNSHHNKWLIKEIKRFQAWFREGQGVIKHLEDLIKCPNCCNGREVGEDAGYSECDSCGDDGHRLYGMEGTRIGELFDYEELQSGQIDI